MDKYKYPEDAILVDEKWWWGESGCISRLAIGPFFRESGYLAPDYQRKAKIAFHRSKLSRGVRYNLPATGLGPLFSDPDGWWLCIKDYTGPDYVPGPAEPPGSEWCAGYVNEQHSGTCEPLNIDKLSKEIRNLRKSIEEMRELVRKIQEDLDGSIRSRD